MLKVIPSVSTELTLDDVLNHLKQKDVVDGILLLGSTGDGNLKPYSDYDLVLVLKEISVPVFSVFTYVDKKIADIYFFTTKELTNLLNKKELDSESMEGKLIYWLLNGKITLDRSNILSKLKKLYSNSDLIITSSKSYSTWFAINFNFAQNMRYYNSGDEIYKVALDIRLLYSVAEIISGYFTLRNIPWRGEKAAIKWLQENDLKFLGKFKEYSLVNERDRKFKLYKEMVEIALLPIGGIWKNDITGVTLKHGQSEKSIDNALTFWNSLIGN